MSENQPLWNSDNQGFKEATFIQMGRRGGDAETGREAWRQGMAREMAVAEWAVPHSCVVDKNQEGHLGSK